MNRSTNPNSPDRSSQSRRISSYDEYIQVYFPKLQEQRVAQAQSPQQFGTSMARDSLARIKEALNKK